MGRPLGLDYRGGNSASAVTWFITTWNKTSVLRCCWWPVGSVDVINFFICASFILSTSASGSRPWERELPLLVRHPLLSFIKLFVICPVKAFRFPLCVYWRQMFNFKAWIEFLSIWDSSHYCCICTLKICTFVFPPSPNPRSL